MPSTRLTKIAYVRHPVTPEQKRELHSRGYRIVDIRFKPEGVPAFSDEGEDAPASVATDTQDANATLAALREEYTAKFDRKPFWGWDADELRRRIDEA